MSDKPETFEDLIGDASEPKRTRKRRRKPAKPIAPGADAVTALAPVAAPADGGEPAGAELQDLIDAMAGLDHRELLFIKSFAACGNEARAARDAKYGRSNNHPTARNSKLARAMRAVQAVVRKRVAFGVIEALQEINDVMRESRQKNQMTAASRCLELKARICGLFAHEAPQVASLHLHITGIDDRPRSFDADFRREDK